MHKSIGWVRLEVKLIQSPHPEVEKPSRGSELDGVPQRGIPSGFVNIFDFLWGRCQVPAMVGSSSDHCLSRSGLDKGSVQADIPDAA